MQINAGELRHKIKIYEKSETDNRGFSKEEDTLVKETYAKFTRRTGREKLDAGQEIQEAYVRFLIRFTSKKLSHEMYVVFNDTEYDIEDINNIGQSNEFIELYCKEREM